MIIADFGVICIGQTECTYPDKTDDIRFEAYQRWTDNKAMYESSYNFQSADSLVGYWYFVWPKEELFYEKPFFDIAQKGRPYVALAQEWVETVRKVMEFFIEQSPEKRIAVLIREQDNSNDVVHSAIKINEFMENLIAGNIKWNELYFIEK